MDEGEMDEEGKSGWDAIEAEFARIYPQKGQPAHHLVPPLPRSAGGDFALGGVSVYDGWDFWHFVTFGQIELYGKESDDEEVSGFGMEFTFKLKKGCCKDETAEIKNVFVFLGRLARASFDVGEVFSENERVRPGLDAAHVSAITGGVTIADPLPRPLSTPNGRPLCGVRRRDGR